MKTLSSSPAPWERFTRTLAIALLATATTVSEAALLNLSNTPLYLVTIVEPNILLTFDDSGSMQWAYLPDDVDDANVYPNDTGAGGMSDQARGCASNINKIYYNPAITYYPPVQSDGQTPLNAAASTFATAYINGYNTAAGTVNLGVSYRPSWNNLTSYATCGQATPTNAFYFVYDPAGTGCTSPSTGRDACYRRVNVTATSAEAQNFTNWYSYYRNRNMMAKTAVGRSFSHFGTNVRIAAKHLHSSGTSTGSSALIFPNNFTSGALRKFTGTNRTDFFTRLYDSPASGNTPLREAMTTAGNYLMTADPYVDTPGLAASSTNPERGCRSNFHILMTDGYWNGNCPNSGTPGGTCVFNGGNQDNTAITLPSPDPTISGQPPVSAWTSMAFTTNTPPYSDANTGSLADQAFFYWARDLRPGLANIVPPHVFDRTGSYSQQFWNAKNDPATWQHMETFTIGLGINGVLVNDTATYNALVAGTTAWPPIYNPPAANTAAADRGKVDDLWHAAINGRGLYFSASDPSTLVSAFTTIVNAVNDRIAAASSVSLNALSLTSNDVVYQSRYNSGAWYGQVIASRINSTTGGLTQLWDAYTVLPTQNFDTGRQILSYNTTSRSGVPFRWNSLSLNQQDYLRLDTHTGTYDGLGIARLDWIRGDASNEGVGYNFRTRTRMCGLTPCPSGTSTGWLGDTIDSNPVYVGIPPFNYPSSLEAQPYTVYKSGKSGRVPTVYVGANDGMLHAFNANTGYEIFAYVPSGVYPNLSALPNSDYTHRFYVDGGLVVVDAYYQNDWHTVLAGTLRNGGQGVYALDVSESTQVTEGTASSKVLWEFTDKDDPDLGYTYGQPAIAKTRAVNGALNGQWAVFVSNGYNNSATQDTNLNPDGNASVTGHAALFVLFIEQGMSGWANGTSYIKLDTGVGSVATPNGLTAPAVVDVNGDYIADYVYAGDLQGNLWRWDIRDPNPNTWSATLTKVFTTGGASNPITGRPVVGANPSGRGGVMVYFGTGKYLEAADAVASGPTQSFYGIWDTFGNTTLTRANLLRQSIYGVVVNTGGTFRDTSNNAMDWSAYRGWFIDLTTPGERVISDPILRGGDVIYTTLIPTSDPCSFGGTGWLMEHNVENGGPASFSPFDVNGDGSVDNLDVILSSAGNRQSPTGSLFNGIPSMPGILTGDGGAGGGGKLCNGQDAEFIQKSDGTIDVKCHGKQGCEFCRNSWRQRR